MPSRERSSQQSALTVGPNILAVTLLFVYVCITDSVNIFVKFKSSLVSLFQALTRLQQLYKMVNKKNNVKEVARILVTLGNMSLSALLLING